MNNIKLVISFPQTIQLPKNDCKCVVFVLLLDTVEQPMIVSHYTFLRRWQVKDKLKYSACNICKRQDSQVIFVQINHCANQFFLYECSASSTNKDKTCRALEFEVLSTLSAESISGILIYTTQCQKFAGDMKKASATHKFFYIRDQQS